MFRISATRAFTVAVIATAVSGVAAHRLRAEEWKQYADEQECGWSRSELSKARDFAESIGSAAVIIVDHGHVVAAWGAVSHPFKAASIRKSMYDVTIGATHHTRSFDLGTDIDKLGIDDLEPLTDREKRATFEELLTARSGIYHPAAYETPSNARRRPDRGSSAPGEQWYYNNWDFNALCSAFEALSGEHITQAFVERVAKPLGMEDFKPSHIFDWLEPRVSRQPAITMRLSARDLARVGRLYLQDGRWGDRQIVAVDWVKRSTEPHTTFEAGHYRGEGNGYGRLWWVFPARPQENSPYQAHHRVAASGAGGQIMVLFPELDVLIVHLADTDAGRGVPDSDVAKLLDMIVGARKSEPAAGASLGPVRVQPISGRPPAPLPENLTTPQESRRTALVGRYAVGDNAGLQLYEFEDRLFVQSLGIPLSDVEMLQASDGSLCSPLVDLVLRPVNGAAGTVDSIRVTFGGRTQTAIRAE